MNFQVGYYTEVAGLGRNPGDVVVNGSINVYNQCDAGGTCIALNNFWRSLSNLTINASGGRGCQSGEFWAVSQASPMRRVQVNGNGNNTTLMDYCTGPSFASGGFIADSRFSGQVINGSQQQFFTRNSDLGGGWSNGVWNQVFAGTTGAPAEDFAAKNYYTTVAATPASREKPYLWVDGRGTWQVFVPPPARTRPDRRGRRPRPRRDGRSRCRSSTSPSPVTPSRRSTSSWPSAGTCSSRPACTRCPRRSR